MLGGADYPKLVWLMDNRLETNPVIISTLPMQDTADFFNRPGRYGAHNIHENRPGELSLQSDTLVYATFFNGGIRVFDTPTPSSPRRSPTSCRKSPKAPTPTASTTSTSTKTASSTS